MLALMSSWDAEDLAELRWHWGGAYVINGSDGVWIATRTDNGTTVFATSAEQLLEKIRRDYAREPVPRPVSIQGSR
jgi:hypothetical protein